MTFYRLSDLVPGDVFCCRNNPWGRPRILIYRTAYRFAYMTPNGELREWDITDNMLNMKYFKLTETLPRDVYEPDEVEDGYTRKY